MYSTSINTTPSYLKKQKIIMKVIDFFKFHRPTGPQWGGGGRTSYGLQVHSGGAGDVRAIVKLSLRITFGVFE